TPSTTAAPTPPPPPPPAPAPSAATITEAGKSSSSATTTTTPPAPSTPPAAGATAVGGATMGAVKKDHNVDLGSGRLAVKMTVPVDTSGMQGKTLAVVVFFYDATGRAIP